MMLTLDDALPVIEQIISSDTILVGGQAINLWASLLGITLTQPSFTRDIDFIGNASNAAKASQRLTIPNQLFLADQNESSINAAVIVIRFPQQNEDTPIDYLMTLYGLDRTELESSAVEVEVGHMVIRVIHPILLMQSKLHNLGLASKRTPEGIEQANISIRITNEFLRLALNNADVNVRDFLNLSRNILRFAKSDAGIDAHHVYGIDCLQSLPVEEMKQSDDQKIQKFLNVGLNEDMRQVTKFRQRRLALAINSPHKPAK